MFGDGGGGGGGGGEWAWTRGRYGDVTRTVVSGRAYVLDVVELASRGDHLIELPWHFRGTGDGGRGTWTSGELADEFVSRVERFVPASWGAGVLRLAEAPWPDVARRPGEVGAALGVSERPPLDGWVTGFDTSEPLRLDLEDQYRRSEEPYSGPEDFSAAAFAAWDDDALYLAVEVTKPDVCFRPPDAPPLRLVNEPADVHSDGLQLYLRAPRAGGVTGFPLVPEGT